MSNSSNKAIEHLGQHDFFSQVSYNLNVFEKNLFYMIFSQVGKDDPAFKVYHISIPMIEQLTGGNLHSEQIYKSVCRLLEKINEIVAAVSTQIHYCNRITQLLLCTFTVHKYFLD